MKRIVFMGTPEFSIPALERLIASEYEIVAVYTRPDKSAGRGRDPSMPPVKVMAQAHGIPLFQPETLKSSSEIEHLASLKPDVGIVIAFGQILPQEVLDIPGFGFLNIHPSLLPRYRGASPVASAILAGEAETGVTIMLLDAGMDTGPILARSRLSIDSEDTTESLEARLAEVGADLLIETLRRWFEQKLVPERQDNREATYTARISKNDGELNWQLPAEELVRRIRAFHPWPGCYTRWRGKTLKVLKAISLPSAERVEPGLVIEMPVESEIPVGIGTGEGILGLSLVQLEGKKSMPITDFLRGQKGFFGQKMG